MLGFTYTFYIFDIIVLLYLPARLKFHKHNPLTNNLLNDDFPTFDSAKFPRRIKFLIIKAKYYVIEPCYMEGTTPDQLP
jgi:hypothetical protein